MALLLRRRGIHRVRPLEGGLDAWLARGYPVAPVAEEVGSSEPDAGALEPERES